MQPTIAFIGGGNMAFSLVQGMLAGTTAAASLRVADPFPEALTKYVETGVPTFAKNDAAIIDADVIVLAVKPQVASPVVSDLHLKSNQLLVSIAAGISLTSLTAWTSSSQPIVRCMPNTPALLGAGMSALFANAACTELHRSFATDILNAAGKTLWVASETELDAVTAVSGSGPAYFFHLMETMIEAGEALGLSRETATELTLQTASGAALMASQTSDDPGTLRQNVTSPGGTTAAALDVMTAEDLRGTVHRALDAAHSRSISLAQEFGAET
ncbi:MAG: pyrroline-5-carboxylate reductase [Pseudomonadales bacterium]|nr:pyrroline-5-carboxylate reductase [Pseudomonadales bacterium]